MAQGTAGSRPGEFGGVPGLYGNHEKGNPLQPHEERMSLTQTDPADETSQPKYGTGGERVV